MPAECAHHRDDPSAIAEPTFSLMGDFSHAIGMSARPVNVSFRCRRCGKIFETTNDKKVLRRYTR
jgi:hypothetical protein